MKFGYRDEIDTLRSIAVIAVIIFHYFPKILPGGYLGVDLFFVISGFVISYQIYKNFNNNNFSFKNFYLKRIRRILPATFFLLIVCSILSSYLFVLSDLIAFSKSLFFSLTFTSNIYFWLTGGYFTTNDELKPLLHLWSLSIEEQFYIFFSIIFLIFLKFIKNKKTLFFIIFLISLISFVLNYFLIKLGGSNPAFFLLPTRIWNFGFGVLAMIFFVNNKKKSHSNLELIIFSGLMVAGFFTEIKNFPRGSLVIFSTAYLLSKNFKNNELISKIYFNPILKKIGLMSFSLYLWHWPFLVYFKYYYIYEVPLLLKIFSIILMLLFSILSFYFVEKKFRYEYSERKTVISLLVIAIFILIPNSLNFNKSNKIVNGNFFSADKISMSIQTNFRCNPNNFKIIKNVTSCYLNNSLNKNYEIGLVGNSHAQMYAPSIINNLKNNNKKGILFAMTGCLPTIDVNVNQECINKAKINFNTYLNDKNIKILIIGTTWKYRKLFDGEKYIDDPNFLIYGKSLLKLVDLINKSGRNVYLIGPIQTPSYNLPSELSRKIKFGIIKKNDVWQELSIKRSVYDQNFTKVKKLLKNEMRNNFIDPSLKQCDSNHCYLGNKNGIFFADLDHLSYYGSQYFSGIFKKVFTYN